MVIVETRTGHSVAVKAVHSYGQRKPGDEETRTRGRSIVVCHPPERPLLQLSITQLEVLARLPSTGGNRRGGFGIDVVKQVAERMSIAPNTVNLTLYHAQQRCQDLSGAWYTPVQLRAEAERLGLLDEEMLRRIRAASTDPIEQSRPSTPFIEFID